MVSPCCHQPADYQYATWHKCRKCGRLFEWMPIEAAPGVLQMTSEMFTFVIDEVTHPRRHASFIPSTREFDTAALL